MAQSIVTHPATKQYVRPRNLLVDNIRDIQDNEDRRGAYCALIEVIEFLLGTSLTRKTSKGSFVKHLVASSFYKVRGQPGKYVDFLKLLDIAIPDENMTGLEFIKSLSEDDVQKLYKIRRLSIGSLRYIRQNS